MNKYSKVLEFNAEKHEYDVLGTKLPSVTEICAPLTYSKYHLDNAMVEQAARRGSVIHELCASYDRGDLEHEETVPADDAQYLLAWIKFCHDYQAKWEYVEIPMATRSFAGTIDRIGIIDGKRVIVDIKTTASMDRANKISLCAQIMGYVFLSWDNDFDCSYSHSMGVQLKKDGTYSVIKTTAVESKYQFNASELWDQLEHINKLTKGAKSVE